MPTIKFYNNSTPIPFLTPALTGIAMLDGMSSAECEVYAYDYNLYQKREGKQ